MGFSFGGAVTVGSMEHVQKLKALGGSEKGFAVYVAYYPACRFRDVLATMDSMMKAEEALEIGDKKGNKFWLEVNTIVTKIVDGQ